MKPKQQKKAICPNCHDDFVPAASPHKGQMKFCSPACAKADAIVNNINETARYYRRKFQDGEILL